MNPQANPLVRLLNSSKALVVALVALGAMAAVHFHVYSSEESKELIKWVVSAYLAAVGVEDAAKHIGAAKVNAAAIAGPTPAPVINVTTSTPPPPPDSEVTQP